MTSNGLDDAVRSRIEAKEDSLSPFALKSADAVRARAESKSQVRAEYQRDRDRVIHSNAFHRLMHKSQVFVNPQGDHFTTRMTHVLQVSQIGRTIARALNLNEDFVEAAALAHDVGHTPFGHIGEKVLNNLLPDGFHHSKQGVRTFRTLEKHGEGLNLTVEVLDAILHHSKPEGRFIDREMIDGMPLEAQIVRISDALAYLAHDITDALRASMITPSDIPPSVRDALGDGHAQRVDALVGNVIRTSWDATGETATSNQAKPWIRMSAEMIDVVTLLRDFMFERVYRPTSDSLEGQRAADIVEMLFIHYVSHIDEIPDWIRVLSIEPSYAAADFVCGMTDRYALMAAERLQPGISEGIFQGRINLPLH